MKFSLILLLGIATGVPLASHDIITTKLTYTRDISPIFVHRCLSCHAEQAAIPLTSYEQVRPWAVGIKEQVLSRAMPPWGAVKGFGRFNPDGGLTQEEIMIVAAWVLGGAPKGNAALLLAPSIPKLKKQDEPHTEELSIATGTTLREGLQVTGIKPLTGDTIASARITAMLPDGHKEPLLWLYEYDGRNNRTFQLRTTLALPAGTIVESTTSLRIELETIRPSSPAQ